MATNYNLMLLNTVGLPNTAIVVGVWPGTTDPRQSPRPEPSFTVTVPVAATDDNPTIITNVHKAVDDHLTVIDTDAALQARAAGFNGVVIPHTH